MTYPVFVALITWGFLHERLEFRMSLALLTAFAGIVLILHPGNMAINVKHLWGLGSGISAALAIICLNRSRKVHDSETVLFYMFGLGSLMIYAGFHDRMVIRHAIDIVYSGSLRCIRNCRSVPHNRGFSICYRRGRQHSVFHTDSDGRFRRAIDRNRSSPDSKRLVRCGAHFFRQCLPGIT